jgi:hypothetical protein
MLVMAVRAGLKFSVILVVVGLFQTQPVAEPLLQFATVGLIPGTDIVLSPNTTLYLSAAVLTTIVGWLIYQHRAFQSALESCLAEYHVRQETKIESLLPSLAGLVIAAGRSLTARANDAPLIIYFWLRFFGQMITERTIALYDKPSEEISRLRNEVVDRIKSHYNNHSLKSLLTSWTQKAKVYLARLSTP